MALLWKDENAEAYKFKAANMNKLMPDVFSFGSPYLTRKTGTTGTLQIAAGTKHVINNSGTYKVYDIGAAVKELTVADLDTGAAFIVGSDYYLYLCDAGADNEVYKLSLNSTFPAGYDANSSRKIGGFHYGYERVSIAVADVREAIVPNSVWDLKHRPKCADTRGMVYLGSGLWVDIYLASVNEAIVFSNGNGSPITAGTCKSTYNSTPLTGTEGLNAYNFQELARRSGKRLLTLSEWLQAAHGHPAGNQFEGKTTNRGTTGEDADIGSISLANVVDCARKVTQWIDEYCLQNTGAAGWVDEMPGMNVGQIYEYGDDTFRQIRTGGHWTYGAYAGSRCVSLYYSPWSVDSSVGCRFACDSL